MLLVSAEQRMRWHGWACQEEAQAVPHVHKDKGWAPHQSAQAASSGNRHVRGMKRKEGTTLLLICNAQQPLQLRYVSECAGAAVSSHNTPASTAPPPGATDAVTTAPSSQSCWPSVQPLLQLQCMQAIQPFHLLKCRQYSPVLRRAVTSAHWSSPATSKSSKKRE